MYILLIPALTLLVIGLALLFSAYAEIIKPHCSHPTPSVKPYMVAVFNKHGDCIGEYTEFKCSCGEIIDIQRKDKK